MSDFQRVLLIVANAGSGKTYRLVTRCLELMARGENPDKILALTFTRKAAGEFVQNLFERVAAAVEDPARLEALRQDVQRPDLTADECLSWLRHLATALPRLSMGTMDGFFGRIVRAFPFELGLGREFRLLDSPAQEQHRQQVLDGVFAAADGQPGGLDQLVELLRQHSRNRPRQSVLGVVAGAVEALQESFLATPAGLAWGDPDAIWPGGSAILSAPPVEDAVQVFIDEMEATNPQLGPGARAQLGTWLDLARAHRPPATMDKQLVVFASKKLSEVKTDADGQNYVPVGNGKDNRLYLRGRLPALRDTLRRSIIRLEIEAKLQSSRALHALLGRYEEIYAQTVRSGGALTFSDISSLLAQTADAPWRRHLDYRLDGRHDHWLLDEFQDTSRTQWKVLEPLAEEIIQDTSGRRSFFYVGDTKQAIYGWRGGDARLFWEIRNRHNQGPEAVVVQDELGISRRSARAVVETVEAALRPGQLRRWQSEFRIPDATVAAWDDAWVEHRPWDRAGEGYARFETVEPTDEDESSETAVEQAVLRIIREADPFSRGLSCAILVRTNETLARYVAVLKSEGVPVAAEGKTNPCLSTPGGVGMLSVVKCAASPADALALAHVEASPLRVLLDGDVAAFRGAAWRTAAAAGFAPLVREWTVRAVAAGALGASEADVWVAAAADFDAGAASAGDWAGFIRFVEWRTLEESESPGAIRVMTVHNAKGLGVDMVILPQLGGKALTDFRDNAGVFLHRDAGGGVQWGVDLPRKDFCNADPVLWQAREEARAAQSYEAFCVLYVGMTRARHALYCVAAGGRDMKNAGNWLARTFPPGQGALREAGDRDWFGAFPLQAPASEQDTPPPPTLPVAATARAVPPSGRRPVATHGMADGPASRRLGTEVHRLLAGIEWLDAGPPDLRGDPDAVRRVEGFLAGSRGAEVFRRPAGDVKVWRECGYDMMTGGFWQSGVIDRVHVRFGRDGSPESAHIFDFKTGSAAAADGQLEDYVAAVSQLLGLPREHITAEVVAVA